MALIEWNNNYSVSVGEMDTQHKKLIALINNLHEAMKTGKAKDIMGAILNELIAYTKTHFAEEEAYMQKINFSELAKQKEAHSAFVKKISEAQKGYTEGKTISIDLLNFLNKWLIEHIVNMDKKYGTEGK